MSIDNTPLCFLPQKEKERKRNKRKVIKEETNGNKL